MRIDCSAPRTATGSVALAGGNRQGDRTGGEPPPPFLLDTAGGYANACYVTRIRQIPGHAQVTLTSGEKVALVASYGSADDVAVLVGGYFTGIGYPQRIYPPRSWAKGGARRPPPRPGRASHATGWVGAAES
jgi:hypothetical protein